jgi:hypothetical protein
VIHVLGLGMKKCGLSSSSLWDEIAASLSILSRRDNVDYRVRATEESVNKKIEELNNV